MSGLLNKIKYPKYFEEKKRFLLFALLLLLVLFSAGYLFHIAYARYEAKTKLNGNLSKALYIFGDDNQVINLFEDGIVPSDDAYVYKFSVSNFNSKNVSDVNIKYNLKIRTTTNLPISMELYRNEDYQATGAVNLFSGAKVVQDENNAWYKIYKTPSTYEMSYQDRVTDIYTVVIKFPSIYKNDITYANYLESIELFLDSEQVV